MKLLIRVTSLSFLTLFFISKGNAMLYDQEIEELKYIISPPQIKDVEQLSNAHVQAWSETYGRRLPKSVLSFFSYDKRHAMWSSFLKESPNKVLIAKRGEELIGFTSWKLADRNTAELLTLYVLNPYQRVGIGSRLLSLVTSALLAEDINKLNLWVLASNPAIEFYKTKGFSEMRREVKTLGDDSFEETLMEKNIEQ
ncbi:MAG: GNAT family N-acetyltransferase [Alphaproteobacteria bacterium]|jgi:ribosomal protein S18 acetylase RimI-like enzyme|nr:GNAT family N-acetyltransferase [Alphaproteobacteria bacterium]